MPKISRLFVVSSLLYLLLTLSVGILRATAPDLPPAATAVVQSFPGYVHLWAIGWLTQLIFGIGYWLLPVINRERRRGPVWPMYGAFICINVGLPLRLATEPFAAGAARDSVTQSAFVASAALLWVSGVLFCMHVWPRIR